MRFAAAAAVLALALPAPALAANVDVRVQDYSFAPSTARVQPGDSVTWQWAGSDDHDVRAFANQSDDFRSAVMAAGSFAHTFSRPGRSTYFCHIHPFMRGAVEVGAFVSRPTARASGHTAKIAFRLSQRARVRVALSGPSPKVVRRLLSGGRRSIAFRHLHPGRYRASLLPTDLAGNTGSTARTRRFRVR